MTYGSGSGLGSKLTLFKANLLRRVGGLAVQHVRPHALEASKTFGKALAWKILKTGRRKAKVVIYVPHFGAYWLHQGRRAYNLPTRKSKKKFLVYYLNPDHDPRLRGFRPGYPVERRQVPDLRDVISRAQLRDDLESGRAIMAGGVGGFPSKPFIEEPMRSFDPSRAIAKDLTDFLRRNVVIRDRGRLTL